MANATALSGLNRIQINLEHEKLDTAKLNKVLDKVSINAGIDWTFGTGVNKANLLYHASLTATNAQAAVDISGSAIKDAFGDDCDFSLLKLLYIKNTDETEDLWLGADADHILILKAKADDIIVIKPGGFFLWVDPIGLDVTSDKMLNIDAETAHVTYDIVLMGEKTP